MAGRTRTTGARPSCTRTRRSGCSSRSHSSTPTRTSRGNVDDGVREPSDLLDRFNELAANYSDETADEFARLQDRIDAADAWNLDTDARDGDGRTAAAARRRRREQALRRRAPPRRALPPAAQRPRSAPARRADQPPRRRVGRLAGEAPRGVQGNDRRRHPRPLLPRQRRRLDPRARSRPRHPLQGQLLRPGSSRSRSGCAGKAQDKARAKTLAAELEWVRENPKGRRKKSKARLARYEEMLAEDQNVKLDEVQIHIPPGPRLGNVVIEAEGLRKGFGDKLLIEDLSFELPRSGIVGVIGPNGAGKTTLFRMLVGDEQPDAGELKLGETRQARLRRSVPRGPRRRSERLGGDLRRPRRDRRRRPQDELARLHRRASTSRAPTSSARSGRSRAASATACTWPSYCAPAATCCCSTSPPTTSTSTRCARSRKRYSPSPAAPS